MAGWTDGLSGGSMYGKVAVSMVGSTAVWMDDWMDELNGGSMNGSTESVDSWMAESKV